MPLIISFSPLANISFDILVDICVTIPTVYFLFEETKQKSLEEIDLLFGGRALGMLSNDLNEKGIKMEEAQGNATQVENLQNP